MKSVSAVIAALFVVAVLAVGSYLGYWWLAKNSTERRYEVNTQTQQYQAGLISQERNLDLDWGRSQDPGQKQAIADQFCAVYPSLNPAPEDLVTVHTTICN